ncbi:MAG: hypothetical protein IT235_06135 [Bacteroidia bacterium]|nr:hypothetical protein [Bacteroidia bacterium]
MIGDNTIVFNRVMVIDRTTGSGTYVGVDGNFSVSIKKNDTLMFAYSGYKTKKICFKDSAQQKEYLLAVKLDPLSYQLKEISIYPVKKLSEVQREIEQMESRKKHVVQLQGVDAIQSPITALYERFSKMEQSKRKVAELENEDMKRSVLKDLFRIYIKYDIIDLSDEQFDDFITFCDLPDSYILNATQYELVESIKYRYNKFVELNDYVRHKYERK